MAITPPCASRGTVVWPKKLSPQATTVPSLLKARLCLSPPATAMTFVCPSGTFTCPKLFAPHAITDPAAYAGLAPATRRITIESSADHIVDHTRRRVFGPAFSSVGVIADPGASSADAPDKSDRTGTVRSLVGIRSFKGRQ